MTLQAQLRTLQRYRRGGEMALLASDARELLKAKARSPSRNQNRTRTATGPTIHPLPPPTSLTALAAGALLNSTADDVEPDGADPQDLDEVDDTAPASLAKVVNELTSELDRLGQAVRPEPIRVTLPSGAEIDREVQTDVLALVGRMVDEATYGGLVEVRGADIATMIRNFNSRRKSSSLGKRRTSLNSSRLSSRRTLSSVPIREAFEQFDAARCELLPMVRQLCVEPLLVAVNPRSGPRWLQQLSRGTGT